MHVHVPRMHARRRMAACSSADDLSRILLLGVWSLAIGADVRFFEGYTEHCRNLLSPLNAHCSSAIDRNDIVELVELVSAHRHQALAQIRDEITAADLKWMISTTDDESVQAALEFVIRLWLFVEPNLSNSALTLAQVVEQELPERASLLPGLAHLAYDFSAKSLTRKAGIKIEWTSYLSEHLSFVGKSRLRIFRHVSALQKYANSRDR